MNEKNPSIFVIFFTFKVPSCLDYIKYPSVIPTENPMYLNHPLDSSQNL